MSNNSENVFNQKYRIKPLTDHPEFIERNECEPLVNRLVNSATCN